LLLSFARLLLYMDLFYTKTMDLFGDSRDGPNYVPLGMGVASVVFYVALIRVGGGFRRGRNWIQLPAGFVLLTALVLLVVNTVNAVASWSAYLGEFTFLTPSGGDGRHALLGGAVTSGLLALVDVALLVSASVLLWQSARYVHWVRGGSAEPERGEIGQVPFPASITFAGWIWDLLGVLWGVFVGVFVVDLLAASGEFASWVLGLKAFVVVELLFVAALVPLLLGRLLLNGRLPSTRGIGVVGMVLMILVVIQGVAGAWHFSTPDPREARDLGPTSKIVLGFLVQAGLALLGMLASAACIVGNSAYRNWLRTARGLRV
jgi:hypothetical protein